MQLQHIDKKIYRSHLKHVILLVVISMLVIALSISTLLIEVIGKPEGSNFLLNLFGVIFAVAVVISVVYKNRLHPYMHEVLYVWQLKQELNAIYRQSAKLKPAIESKNQNALIIQYFNLQGSIQLYELDDNDLTLNDLKADLQALEIELQRVGIVPDTGLYRRALLEVL